MDLKKKLINLLQELSKYTKENWTKWIIAGAGAIASFLAGIGVQKIKQKYIKFKENSIYGKRNNFSNYD